MRAECIIGAMMSQSRNFLTKISLIWLVLSVGLPGDTEGGRDPFLAKQAFAEAAEPLLLPISRVALQASDLDPLINALQTKYDRMTSLAADFTQVYNARGERTRRESGTLLLKKPGRMRWDYTTPERKQFISDGKWLYEYIETEKMATRSAVRESDDLRAPFAILLGRGKLRRDFQRIEFASETPTKAGNRVLRLIPKRTQDFRELLVEVEPGSLQLARLVLIDRNSARSDFLFSNVRENAPASEAQFVFKAPAGVQVVQQ
jgi:outer membrane lipoprotein carrier protein